MQQVNGGVKHLVMQAALMESFRNTGCLSNEEWRMEHGVPESVLEDKERSHKVGLGRLAVLQDEMCEEELKSLAACTGELGES
ncbi:hypothetical protein ACFXTO_036464 [Malus domestica]